MESSCGLKKKTICSYKSLPIYVRCESIKEALWSIDGCIPNSVTIWKVVHIEQLGMKFK